MVRNRHREALREIVTGANDMLNYEQAQTQEALRLRAQNLVTWLQNSSALEEAPSVHVQDSLIAATSIAHPGTIRAAITREGNWPKLSYGHHLSHGARRMTAQVTEPKLKGFRVIATNVLQQPALAPAHDLVRQALRTMEDGFDDLMRKVQLVGQSVYSDELSVDADFWKDAAARPSTGFPFGCAKYRNHPMVPYPFPPYVATRPRHSTDSPVPAKLVGAAF